MRGLGSENIDYRLRHADFAGCDGRRAGWARRSRRCRKLQRVLVVGSFLRKDHPLFAQRIAPGGAQGRARCISVHAAARRLADADAARASPPAPSAWLAGAGRRSPPPSPRRRASPRRRHGDATDEAKAIAAVAAERRAQGHAARQRRRAASADARAARAPGAAGSPSRPAPASATSAKAATPSARSWSARCRGAGGLNAGQMLGAGAAQGLLLLNAEPALDAADRRGALAALGRRRDGRRADPFKPPTATSPTCCCRSRRSPKPRAPSSTPKAACRASTASSSRWAKRGRPGRCCACSATCWACRASTFETSEEVRAEALGDVATIAARLAAQRGRRSAAAPRRRRPPAALERIADVPIYATDAIVRRAPSLQLTADARAPRGALAGGAVAAARRRRRRHGAASTQGSGRSCCRRRVDASLAAERRCACRRPSGDRGAGRDVRRRSRVEKAGAWTSMTAGSTSRIDRCDRCSAAPGRWSGR